MSDDFEQLLRRIREREHPHHGAITWDGRQRTFEISVQFTRNGQAEDAEIIRLRALRYLGGLTETEREAAHIDIQLKDGIPVRAVLKGNTSDLNPERLKRLEQQAFMAKPGDSKMPGFPV